MLTPTFTLLTLLHTTTLPLSKTPTASPMPFQSDRFLPERLSMHATKTVMNFKTLQMITEP